MNPRLLVNRMVMVSVIDVDLTECVV